MSLVTNRSPCAVEAITEVAAEKRPRRWWFALVVVALLAEMAIAMITTAVEQTPTIDEPVYVGTAVVYLEQHSLRYNPEHPPLGKLIIATGLAFAGAHLDPAFAGDQTQLGRHVLYESGDDPGRLLLSARLPVIVLTLLFGLVVFAFARDLTGPAGGVTALALYAFSPDLIAHGSLATLDVPVAGFLLTSVWLVWRARRRPLRYLPLAGLALGAAVATKMSALAAVPVLLLLVVLSVWHARRGTGPQRMVLGVAAAVAVALLAVAVVWASYLAVDPRLRWTTPPNLPAVHGLRALADWLPLPRPYRDGMRVQFAFEDQTWSSFLFGLYHAGSLWYYLPAALLVKTPLGALALGLAGAVVLVAIPRLRPAAPYVLVPAAVLLAAAMTSTRDLGVRYAIFVPMFLAIAAAGVVAIPPAAGARRGGGPGRLRRRQLAADVPVLPALLQRGVRRPGPDPPAPARLERRLGPGPGPAGRPAEPGPPGRADLARLQGQRRAVRVRHRRRRPARRARRPRCTGCSPCRIPPSPRRTPAWRR